MKTQRVGGVLTKVQTGWGATCKRHLNVAERNPNVVCKKNLQRGTSDYHRRLVMYWLVLGSTCEGENARTDHVALDPELCGPCPSEADLVEHRIRLFGS